MTPAQQPDESTLRLERIIALIDDLDRLKQDPKARRIAMERMQQELKEVKKPAA
jgi:hypothetical protein